MGRLAGLFARRYLFSKKSHAVINFITVISAVAIAVPVAAMVILLSVFNGFEGLVKQLYGDFDPDVLVRATEGKTFGDDAQITDRIRAMDGVVAISRIVEDNALLEYNGRQFIASVRGVDESYADVVPIVSLVSSGIYEPYFGDMPQTLVGEGVAYNLGINSALAIPLTVTVPRRVAYNPIVPLDNYRQDAVWPSGTFAVDAETDGRYIIVPIEFARGIFEYPDRLTAYFVKLSPKTDPEKFSRMAASVLGDQYTVLSRYRQRTSLYQIMRYEKWGIFTIIMMVLIISSFSVVGSVVMLVLEKKKDIATLRAVGADSRFIRSVFRREGLLISVTGAAGGLMLGLLFCWIQIRFGIITIPADTFLINEYPVTVMWADLLVIAAAVTAVNFLIINFTVSKIIPQQAVPE